MITRLYEWALRMAAHRHALPALAAVSFIESSVFPVPPDIMVLPMVLAKPRAAWLIATVCTVASVLGGLAGYAIGALLFETVGRPLLDLYGYGAAFQEFQELYHAGGAWIVFGAGITPFPYKVITIASGAVALDPVTFVLASVFSRGLRFFLECGLLYFFGEPIRVFIERYLTWLVTLFFLLLLGGFVLVEFVL